MKTYITESLSENEKLVYSTRPHWIIFTPSIATLIAALLIFIYLPDLIMLNEPVWRGFTFHQLISIAFGIAGGIAFLSAFLFYTTSEYGVTNKRVIMKRGFIQRYSTEVFLSKIEGINIDQSFTGRILDYGSIIIVGTGGTNDYYNSVPNPVKFRKAVQQQL